MATSNTLLLLCAALAVATLAHAQRQAVLVDSDGNDVFNRLDLVDKPYGGQNIRASDNLNKHMVPWWPISTRRPTVRWRYTTTTRRPSTTTRRPSTTTRRPSTTTCRPFTTTSSQDQSFYIGGVYPYDRQLLSKTVYKSSTIFTVNTETLDWSTAATIHCIQVVDLQKNGQNAAVTVQRGGVGQHSVSLKFKSQRGGKINYLVIIWGQ